MQLTMVGIGAVIGARNVMGVDDTGSYFDGRRGVYGNWLELLADAEGI